MSLALHKWGSYSKLTYGEVNKQKGKGENKKASSLSGMLCSTVAHLQIYEWAHPVWVSPIVMMKWNIFQNEQVWTSCKLEGRGQAARLRVDGWVPSESKRLCATQARVW